MLTNRELERKWGWYSKHVITRPLIVTVRFVHFNTIELHHMDLERFGGERMALHHARFAKPVLIKVILA